MSVYKRGSGRYQVLIDLEPTALGGRLRKALGCFRTRKLAEAVERKALEARDRGCDLSPQTVTVRELLEKYAERCRTKALATKTLERTRSLQGVIFCGSSVASRSHGSSRRTSPTSTRKQSEKA